MSLNIDPALLPALAAFERVARHQSFSRAAEEMGVSASALSQTVRSLEGRLGMRLLARTTRRVACTEEGAALLRGVREGLGTLADALDSLDAHRGRPRGMVRVTVPRMAYFQHFLPRLASFHARYPEVELEFSLDDHLIDLVGEGFDAGVRIGEQIDRDMIALPIGGPLRLVTVGAPAYFRRHPVPQVPEALADHECTRYRYATSGRISPWMFARDGERIEVAVGGRLILNDLVAEIAVAHAGLALVQTVESAVQDDIAQGALVPVLEPYTLSMGRMYLYFPSREQLPLRVRCFIDHFRAEPD